MRMPGGQRVKRPFQRQLTQKTAPKLPGANNGAAAQKGIKIVSKIWRAVSVRPQPSTIQNVGRASYGAAHGLAGLLLIATLAWAQLPGAPAAPLAPVIPEIKQHTPVPILLPTHLPPLLGPGVYASAEATPTSYTIRLESEPDCHQSDVCYVGELKATKGGAFTFPEAVQIDKVVQGRFQPATCSGTCSPAAIEWKWNGVLYTAQLNLRARSAKDQRSALLQLAENATRCGAR